MEVASEAGGEVVAEGNEDIAFHSCVANHQIEGSSTAFLCVPQKFAQKQSYKEIKNPMQV
jgi:hypothetical protein